jgi:hypothetical protein
VRIPLSAKLFSLAQVARLLCVTGVEGEGVFPGWEYPFTFINRAFGAELAMQRCVAFARQSRDLKNALHL